jgi:hypothetical protein
MLSGRLGYHAVGLWAVLLHVGGAGCEKAGFDGDVDYWFEYTGCDFWAGVHECGNCYERGDDWDEFFYHEWKPFDKYATSGEC